MLRLFLFFFPICFSCLSSAIELTFELPDNANQCFYEEVKANVDCVIEFQVVTGGQYDVDVVLENPNGKILYKEARKQLDTHNYKTEMAGTYKVCFSNEFSTFSHKVVYMDWQFGDTERANGRPTPRVATMSQLDSSTTTIGDRLRIVDDYQTHHRLREATSRKRAEDLNEVILLGRNKRVPPVASATRIGGTCHHFVVNEFATIFGGTYPGAHATCGTKGSK